MAELTEKVGGIVLRRERRKKTGVPGRKLLVAAVEEGKKSRKFQVFFFLPFNVDALLVGGLVV